MNYFSFLIICLFLAGYATLAPKRNPAPSGVVRLTLKHFSILGIYFILQDINDKGIIIGTCNTLLDACPYVGLGKFAAECFTGDGFPDKNGE